MSDESVRDTANAAFRFLVAVDGESQAAFTECTLPTIEWEVEEVREGGLNAFTHQLPAQRKAATLSLKNGVGRTALLDWYLESIGGAPSRKTITIPLLNVERQPVMSWHITGAFPARWEGPQLQSDANTVAIQTLELACGEVTASYE